MKNIQNDIKTKSFKPLYLIYGEEGKLREDTAKKLEAAVLEVAGAHERFDEGFDSADLINSANTLSLFGGMRLIVVKDSGVFSSVSDDRLTGYINDPNPDAVIVFNEKKVDKRNKLYKAISKTGYVLECKKATAKDVRDFCISSAKNNKKRFDRGALDLLTSNLENDLSETENEMEKLLCYTMGSEVITMEDVDCIVTKRLEGRIFDLIDAVCRRQSAKALDIFSNMLLLKESPVMIIVSLSRQFRLILQYKFLAGSMSHDDIVKKMKVHPYAGSKIAACRGSFTNRALLAALKDCRDLLKAAFSGNIELERGIELIILKYTC